MRRGSTEGFPRSFVFVRAWHRGPRRSAAAASRACPSRCTGTHTCRRQIRSLLPSVPVIHRKESRRGIIHVRHLNHVGVLRHGGGRQGRVSTGGRGEGAWSGRDSGGGRGQQAGSVSDALGAAAHRRGAGSAGSLTAPGSPPREGPPRGTAPTPPPDRSQKHTRTPSRGTAPASLSTQRQGCAGPRGALRAEGGGGTAIGPPPAIPHRDSAAKRTHAPPWTSST